MKTSNSSRALNKRGWGIGCRERMEQNRDCSDSEAHVRWDHSGCVCIYLCMYIYACDYGGQRTAVAVVPLALSTHFMRQDPLQACSPLSCSSAPLPNTGIISVLPCLP